MLVVLWNNLQDLILLLYSLLFLSKVPSDLQENNAVFFLHEDVLFIIYDYLSIVDKACFALSCKRYYNLFGNVTKEEAFDFPRLLKIKVPELCVNKPELLRNQLLVRLEDTRWAFCGGCLKLHPRREFPEANLASPPIQRNCGFNTGIVDLCPCISLTFREREQLIKALQLSPKGCDAFELKKPLTLRVDEQGQAFFEHNCSIDTFVDGRLVVTTSIKIDFSIDDLAPCGNCVCDPVSD